MSDKSFMLISAFISVLCVIWAIAVEVYGMAVLMIFNTLFSLWAAYKMKDPS